MEKPAVVSTGNPKSDVPAKRAFCLWLAQHGYSDPRVSASPADVVARKDRATWLFEIKTTREKRHYFGAATLTEWVAAAQDPDHFHFVIAYEIKGAWRFDLYTPEQFMAFSYVPPFKINFNVPLNDLAARKRAERSKRVHLTKARLRLLTEQFELLRKLEQ